MRRKSVYKGREKHMRIFTIALCILSLACITSWAQVSVGDPNPNGIQLVGSKSLAHIIDLSDAQDGMAPQKTDLPQAMVGGVASDASNRNRPRAD